LLLKGHGYPANTQNGEKARLNDLDSYLARRNICPGGYEIVHREKQHPVLSPKHSVEDQELLSVTYFGQCRPLGGSRETNPTEPLTSLRSDL
jgi:hypothetical protein